MGEGSDDKLRENAASPRKASGDSGSMEQHSLAEQIATDRYLASKEAMKSRRPGIRVSRLVPPGGE